MSVYYHTIAINGHFMIYISWYDDSAWLYVRCRQYNFVFYACDGVNAIRIIACVHIGKPRQIFESERPYECVETSSTTKLQSYPHTLLTNHYLLRAIWYFVWSSAHCRLSTWLYPKTWFCRAEVIHSHLYRQGPRVIQPGLSPSVPIAGWVQLHLGSHDYAEARKWAKLGKSWILCLSQALTFRRDGWTCTD